MAYERIEREAGAPLQEAAPQQESSSEDPRRQAAMMRRALQRKSESGRDAALSARAHQAADKGVAQGGGALPHMEKLQHAFGPEHDLSSVKAHVGGAAAEGSKAIGARAYTTGSSIAFKESPDLRLAAHEAAHVVQQRAGQGPSGGVGKEGDSFEQHADQVAEAVVGGKSAAPLLQGMKGSGGPSVQRAVQMEGEPEIEATEDAMGEHVAEGMDQANKPPVDGQTGAITGGVQYWYNAQGMIEEAGGDFKDDYRMGHHFTAWTSPQSPFFTQPDQTGQFMRFELKPGQSASKALQAWLKGPTIAECLSTVYALETDAMRAAVGDQQFDALFGSEDAEVDKGVRQNNQQLVISADSQGNDTNVAKYRLLQQTELAASGKGASEVTEEDLAKLKEGDWYYFKNHPDYLKKHPGGAWQGENAIFMGKDEGTGERLWSGLGASKNPEAHMFEAMTGDYNRERDDEDYRVMIEGGILVKDQKKGTVEVDGKKYRFADPDYEPGKFPDQVDEASVKAAGGGLLPETGTRLDAEKIAKLRPQKKEEDEEDGPETKPEGEREHSDPTEI